MTSFLTLTVYLYGPLAEFRVHVASAQNNNLFLLQSIIVLDLPPGAAENTHTSPVFTAEEVGEGPPLPPRVNVSRFQWLF